MYAGIASTFPLCYIVSLSAGWLPDLKVSSNKAMFFPLDKFMLLTDRQRSQVNHNSYKRLIARLRDELPPYDQEDLVSVASTTINKVLTYDDDRGNMPSSMKNERVTRSDTVGASKEEFTTRSDTIGDMDGRRLRINPRDKYTSKFSDPDVVPVSYTRMRRPVDLADSATRKAVLRKSEEARHRDRLTRQFSYCEENSDISGTSVPLSVRLPDIVVKSEQKRAKATILNGRQNPRKVPILYYK